MRSYLKPQLPNSPICLRSRQVFHSNASSLQTPQGFQKPRRVGVADLELISSEIHALANMVKDEFAEEDRRRSRLTSSNVENLASNSVQMFERGRFYEEYSAKRNERLRKKKGEEESVTKGTYYNLGVNHEPMTNKKRGMVKKSLKKMMGKVETTPRYSLRSMMKKNKKPPLIPLNVDTSAITTRKERRI